MTSTETLVFQPGEVIAGKYEVLKHLGEGGMGVVVSARHRDLDTRVAIKVVRPEYAQNEQIVARMLLEARSAAKIRSEHVCKVLDVGRLETGVPYIVMEYLDGQDLGQALAQQGKLPLQTAIDYVLQACEALAEAHAAQIVHRDLKPENLFLAHRADGSAQVKVLDFGISKSLKTDDRASALTNPSSAVGSPFYMSPEQMLSARDVDARTDLWALGVIVHELLTGQPPFYSDTLPGVCALVLNQPPPPLRTLLADAPLELELVLQKCLQKNRDDRYSSVGEVARALAPFGSAHARTSAERVSRILGDASLRPPAGEANLVGKLETNVLGATIALTAPGVTRTTGNLHQARRSYGLTTVVLGLAVLLGGGVLWWAFGADAPSNPATLGAASAAPAKPSEATALSQALPLGLVPDAPIVAPTIEPASGTQTPASAAIPNPPPATAAPEQVRRKPTGARPKPAGSLNKSAPDPFDPGAFGSRR